MLVTSRSLACWRWGNGGNLEGGSEDSDDEDSGMKEVTKVVRKVVVRKTAAVSKMMI